MIDDIHLFHHNDLFLCSSYKSRQCITLDVCFWCPCYACLLAFFCRKHEDYHILNQSIRFKIYLLTDMLRITLIIYKSSSSFSVCFRSKMGLSQSKTSKCKFIVEKKVNQFFALNNLFVTFQYKLNIHREYSLHLTYFFHFSCTYVLNLC